MIVMLIIINNNPPDGRTSKPAWPKIIHGKVCVKVVHFFVDGLLLTLSLSLASVFINRNITFIAWENNTFNTFSNLLLMIHFFLKDLFWYCI